MEELFLSFWNRSVSAGWLILAIVALRLALKKAPRSSVCLLWLLVGVRLVCPFTIQSEASLLPSAEMIPQTVLTQPPPQIHTGIEVLNSGVNEQLAIRYVEGVTVPAGQTRSIVQLCAGVWLLGMAVMALWGLMSWLRLKRRVAEAVPDGDGVWLCDTIASPFLLGIFQPRIYLPPSLDGDSRTYVVAHERAHIRRLDHLAKPAGFLLLSVYWFQPLVWLAYVLLCRDIELACDERVIRELGAACKKPYAEALLRCSVRRGGAAVLAFGEVGVKERVKNVLNYKKPSFWLAAASLALCAVAAVCFLTDPVEEPVQSAAEPVPMSQPVSNNRSVGQLLEHHSGHHPGHHEDIPVTEPYESYTTYAGGALMYQPSSSSCGFQGWHPAIREYADDTLEVTEQVGTTTRYRLSETTVYTREEFYKLYAYLDNQEAAQKTTLIPQDVKTLTRYTYQTVEPDAAGNFTTISLWKWEEYRHKKLNMCWVEYDGRLFDLIKNTDILGSFCYDDCILWDYVQDSATAIPIRFDVDSPITILAKTGTLFTSTNGKMREARSSLLEIEPGETIYWQPFKDDERTSKADFPVTSIALQDMYYKIHLRDGSVLKNAELIYKFNLDESRTVQDTLELRPMTNGEGLYGSTTYGICNNWFSGSWNINPSTHYSVLETDLKTGELVVCRDEGTPANNIYAMAPEDFPTEKPETPPRQLPQ